MKFSTETWIGWIGAIVLATAGIFTYVYANFETIDHAKERQQTHEKQLDRIEKTGDETRKTVGDILLRLAGAPNGGH